LRGKRLRFKMAIFRLYCGVPGFNSPHCFGSFTRGGRLAGQGIPPLASRSNSALTLSLSWKSRVDFIIRRTISGRAEFDISPLRGCSSLLASPPAIASAIRVPCRGPLTRGPKEKTADVRRNEAAPRRRIPVRHQLELAGVGRDQ